MGWVNPIGPAWEAGLRPGDTIIEVDGHKVSKFTSTSPDSITWRIVTSEGTNVPIRYQRGDTEAMAYPVATKLPTKWYERKSLRKLLIAPAQPTIIASVVSNSPAALAGLRADDEIVAVNGETIHAPEAVEWEQNLMTNGVKPVTLGIRRGQEQFECTLLAEKPIKPTNAPPVFGLALWFGSTNETLSYPNPIDQIRQSAGMIFATLNTVISRKSDVGVQQLGGPVMIIRVYKVFFESENGWRRVLWFSVMLNVNLALLNLLPFPVLDGGHIALSVIEAIRRRSVSARFLNALQSACAVVLIAFMLFIAFYDIGDWFRSARESREPTLIFAPKN
jgi:regulator of sigma E protease